MATTEFNSVSAVKSLGYVWDPDLLDYVVATASGAGAGGGGDASAANQTTEISRLTSILAQLDVALSTRASAAKQDSLLTELQAKADLTETQPVSLAAIPINAAAATSAKQDTGNASLASVDTKLTGVALDGTDINAPTAMPAGGVGIRGWLSAIWTKLNGSLAVTLATNTPDVTDRAARLLGHVTVDAAPSTAVTGPLTDTQLRAAAVPVSGPVTDAQLRAAAVPVSGPVTDAQLRAAAVPVSGPATDAQLRAVPLPVSGSVSVSNFPASFSVSNMIPAVETGLAKDANVAPFVAPAAGGYVRQDSTGTMAKETGGNLAATAASLGTIDAKPSAYSVLDRLYQLGAKIDAHARVGATEATMKQLLSTLKPVSGPSRTTLLHRS